MKNLPSAIDAAKKLIEDNPDLFKDDYKTHITISLALLAFSKKVVYGLLDEKEPDNLPEVFTDIFKQFKFQ